MRIFGLTFFWGAGGDDAEDVLPARKSGFVYIFSFVSKSIN